MIALEIIQRNYESEGLIPKRENALDIQNFIEQDNIKLIDVVGYDTRAWARKNG